MGIIAGIAFTGAMDGNGRYVCTFSPNLPLEKQRQLLPLTESPLIGEIAKVRERSCLFFGAMTHLTEENLMKVARAAAKYYLTEKISAEELQDDADLLSHPDDLGKPVSREVIEEGAAELVKLAKDAWLNAQRMTGIALVIIPSNKETAQPAAR